MTFKSWILTWEISCTSCPNKSKSRVSRKCCRLCKTIANNKWRLHIKVWVSLVKIYQILIYALGASILVRKYAKYCPAQTICQNFNCKFSTHELSETIIIIFPVIVTITVITSTKMTLTIIIIIISCHHHHHIQYRDLKLANSALLGANWLKDFSMHTRGWVELHWPGHRFQIVTIIMNVMTWHSTGWFFLMSRKYSTERALGALLHTHTRNSWRVNFFIPWSEWDDTTWTVTNTKGPALLKSTLFIVNYCHLLILRVPLCQLPIFT